MFRRLPHPLLHQLGLHWPSPLLLRALPRPVRQQQPHRALECHSPLPRFLFCFEYKVGHDYDFNGRFPFLQGLDIRCFWSWLASGCTTTWSSPGSSFTSSKSSSAFPLGSCHGPHAETGKYKTREKIINFTLNPQLEHRQLHGHQLRAHKWFQTCQQQQHGSRGVLHKENAWAFPWNRTGKKITIRVF